MLCSKNNKRKQLIPLIPQFFPKLTVCAWTQHLSFWFLLSSQFLRCMLVWMFVWMAVSPRVVVWWMLNSWFNPQAPWLWRRTLRSWGWSRRTAQEPVFTRPPQVSQVFSHNTSRIPLNLVNICVCVWQLYGKSVCLRCFCQRKRKSSWRRWRATGKLSSRRSEHQSRILTRCHSGSMLCTPKLLSLFVFLRSLVDAVYALKDEVHELKKVQNAFRTSWTFLLRCIKLLCVKIRSKYMCLIYLIDIYLYTDEVCDPCWATGFVQVASPKVSEASLIGPENLLASSSSLYVLGPLELIVEEEE